MARLIDADEWIKKLNAIIADEEAPGNVKDNAMFLVSEISTEPTAYDVEKVVAELEQTLGNTNFEKATSEVNESYYDGLSYAYGEAINIVRKGGIE